MEPHYVYILYSESADKYYIGQTPDLETCLLFHNELSEHSFTSRYRPWTLKLSIAVDSRGTARKIENYPKKRRSRPYLERLIEEPAAVEKLLERFSSSAG